MRLPINIEDLLNKRKIEGNRIEFKKGWNVTEVERRANLIGMPSQSKVNDVNDFDETGGGYEANGSPSAKIETDDERTYFLIDIPCHPYFVNKAITIDSSGANDGNVTKDVTKELTDRQKVIVETIKEDAFVTTHEMSQKTGVVTRTIKRDLEYLQSADIIIRVDGRKDGHWEVLT